MPLDPKVKAYLDQINAGPSSIAFPPQQVRADRRATYGKVEDRLIPGPAGQIPIRIYRPAGMGPFPILVYFHGGGFVLGDIDGGDPFCRTMTNWVGCVTVSVDYRLAPEHKFPDAIEDSYAATRWIAENAASIQGDPTLIAVTGESAGGGLAAAVPLLCRERGGPHLAFQLPLYPILDVSNYDTESWRNIGSGYSWSREVSETLVNKHYLNDQTEALSPLVSPLLAPDLRGLPPALVVTAEYDPLCDEGEAYVNRLREADVPAELKCYEGVIHGFFSATAASKYDQNVDALADVVKALRKAFGK